MTTFAEAAEELEDRVSRLEMQCAEQSALVWALAARVTQLESQSPPDGSFSALGYATVTGGTSPYVVTSLANDGPGTLRDAISVGGRHITFGVDGVIRLDQSLVVKSSNTTVDARGRDITIQNQGNTTHPMRLVTVANVALLNLRLQAGPGGSPDSLNLYQCEDVLLDHLSIRWGVDECLGITDCGNITIQHSIIAEGLDDSTHHELKPHSCGCLINNNTNRINLYGCLIAHNRLRSPQWGQADNPNAVFAIDNCVIYNDGGGNLRPAIEFKKNGVLNCRGNHYKKGLDGKNDFAMGMMDLGGRVYESGNSFEGVSRFMLSNYQRIDAPHDAPLVPLMDSLVARDAVLECAGAWPRDATDLRIVADVRNGTGRVKNTPPEWQE